MASTTPDRPNPSRAPGSPPMKPGDEAPAGTIGTGENVCPVCNGRGRVGAESCANCAGTGKVTTGIGGA
jgi:DnaJ-class molecular chaperone